MWGDVDVNRIPTHKQQTHTRQAFKTLHLHQQPARPPASPATAANDDDDTTPSTTPALLASLSLLAALQLWEATPVAWAAAWLPGYHLLRAGLHLLIAQEGSQVRTSYR